MPVADPTAYGLVHLQDGPLRQRLRREAQSDQIDTNLISAGAYVLEREVLELVPPDRNVSIEREVWPLLIGNGLYGFASESYWLDIGTPERYLQGTFDIIEGNVQSAVQERLGSGYLAVADSADDEGRVIPPAVIERGVQRRRPAPTSAASWCSARASRSAPAPRSSARSSAAAPTSARAARCATASSPPAAAWGRHADPRRRRAGEGVTVGSENTIAHGARIFPGVTLPTERFIYEPSPQLQEL